MKTKYLFFAALAGLTLASCADDVYVGDNSPNVVEEATAEQGIFFGGGFKAVTRANSVGADAATLLNNRFVVGGFKTPNNGSNYTTVFKDYSVEWAANSAGTTESNTSDWEYVGKTKSVLNDNANFVQSIKYWDYSDDGTADHAWYDFIAYSTHMTAANEVTSYAADKVAVSAIDHAKLEDGTNGCYTLEADRDELLNCYVADMVRVPKASFGNEVTLQFRALTSKVRVALYETVPGYSVTNVKFYTEHPTTLGTGSDVTSALIGAFGNKAKYAVYFPSTDSYKAHVKIVSHTDDSYATFGTVATAQLEAAEKLETGGIVYLGRSSNDASFYGTGTFFQQVLPNEEGGALELAVDYDLVPIDGTDGVIHVYGATAYVPATYTQWLANYAYTYIFKISDNSNGWTSKTSTDPAGLFPITFDAIVLDSEEKEQKTITTVALPSITTYQKGHDRTKNEYSASATEKDIYIQVMGGISDLKTLTPSTNAFLYTVTNDGTTTISEATVMDALHITESAGEGRNGLNLTTATLVAASTIPGEDGNNITPDANTAVKFTPVAPTAPAEVKYYAFVYNTGKWNGYAVKLDGTTTPTDWPDNFFTDPTCLSVATGATPSAGTYYKKNTYIYTAVETSGASAPTGWDTDGVWYKDPDGKTSMYGETWTAGTYYKKYTVDATAYAVKVIKVVE